MLCILFYQCCPTWQPVVGSTGCTSSCSGLFATVINEFTVILKNFFILINSFTYTKRCFEFTGTNVYTLLDGLLQCSACRNNWPLNKMAAISPEYCGSSSVCSMSGARHWDHITPGLCNPHWCRVWQRIIFKSTVLVFFCVELSWVKQGLMSHLTHNR